MKKNHKKIILILLMLVLSFTMLNTVSAAITSTTGSTTHCKTQKDNDGNDITYIDEDGQVKPVQSCTEVLTGDVVTDGDDFGNGAMTVVSKALEYVLQFAGGGTFFSIGITIVALAGVILVILNGLFSITSGSWSSAMPDALVFNEVPFMDANFINPHTWSFWSKLGNGENLAGNLFESFRAIAISLMIIAAMITGLKLALSSIAAKKAQYKEAVMKWVAGFAILLCLKWIMAGVFYINERLVAGFAVTASSSNFTIPVYLTDAVPWVGKLLSDLTRWIAPGDSLSIKVPGYWGIIFANMLKGIGGDVIAAVVAFVIVGQACVVVGAYLKRLFMCFILGVVSPLIVAADTITGITGGKSTIFQNWLKNFIFTVFTQSFHAAYMVVGFYILNNTYSNDYFTDIMRSIITIFILTGLVKLEKVLKGMFGFGDGMAGSLADGTKGFRNALGAISGLSKATRAIGDNKGKLTNASRKRERATYEANKATAYENAKKAKASGNMAEYYRQRDIFAENSKKLKEFDSKYGVSAGNGAPQGGTQDPVKSAIANNSITQTAEERATAARAAQAQAIREERSAKFAALMGPANLAAGIGIGLGSGEEIGEALFRGGIITEKLDQFAENSGSIIKTKEERVVARQQARERRDAEKEEWREAKGFSGKAGVVYERVVEKNADAADKLSRLLGNSSSSSKGSGSGTSSTTQTQQQAQQVNLTIDTAKISQDISRQLNKAMSGIGEDIGRAIRNELKNIDKDIDNE